MKLPLRRLIRLAGFTLISSIVVQPLFAWAQLRSLSETRQEKDKNAHEAKDKAKSDQAKKSKGGDFWNTQNVRVGQRFGTAVVRAAREGRLLYREAYQLTGLSGSTFDRFAENLGFRV